MGIEIDGLDSLYSKLKNRAAAAQAANIDCEVSFEAPHALYIHENMNPKTLGAHVPRPSGLGWYWGPADFGPKFLESSFRELIPELFAMLRKAFQSNDVDEMRDLVMEAGLRVMRLAQSRVPVEHGDLLASASTKIVPRL